jgi:hypothetical protein
MNDHYEILFYVSWFIGMFLSFGLGAVFGIATIWYSGAKDVKELKIWIEEEE